MQRVIPPTAIRQSLGYIASLRRLLSVGASWSAGFLRDVLMFEHVDV